MLTDCPNCRTAYDVPAPRSWRLGRKVVCAICTTRWTAFDAQQPPAAAPLVRLDDDEPSPGRGPDIRIDAESQRWRRGVSVASMQKAQMPPAFVSPVGPKPRRWRVPLTVAASLACAMGLVGQRDRVVGLVPAANGFFRPLGLAVNLRGLELRDMHSRLVAEGSRQVLAVEGEIANVKGKTVTIPGVRVSVRDTTGREVYSWITAAPKPTLQGGETIAFRARLASPPAEGQQVKVQFAALEPQAAPGSARRRP